jgi:hypothetical protein
MEIRVKLDPKKKHWYQHAPKLTETVQEGKVTTLMNQQVKTDRAIPNDKPDIIICDDTKKHAC